jgi:hypothetical protein
MIGYFTLVVILPCGIYSNDMSIQARLMSLTPLALQTAFTQIHKKRVPDVKRRGRLFEAAIMRLTQWWTEVFFDVRPRGSGEVRSQTFDEVAAELLQQSTYALRPCISLIHPADAAYRRSRS